MNLGKTIHLLMKEKKITQKELSSKINISRTSMSLIITGKTHPRVAHLRGIADVLGLPIEVIIMLSIEREDVPKEKHPLYDLIWPAVSSAVKSIFL